MSEFDRLQKLVAVWQAHAREAGHNLETDKYDRNLGCTFIMCCAKGCKWAHSLALDSLTKGER